MKYSCEAKETVTVSIAKWVGVLRSSALSAGGPVSCVLVEVSLRPRITTGEAGRRPTFKTLSPPSRMTAFLITIEAHLH